MRLLENVLRAVFASSILSTALAGTINRAVEASTAGTGYTVAKDGSGNYKTISAAISALPNDGQQYTVTVMPGVYVEQISITRSGKTILIGHTSNPHDYSNNQVSVQYKYGVDTSLGEDEKTPVITSRKNGGSDRTGLAIYNINFENTFVYVHNSAGLAANFYGYNIACYGCSFTGYQDTLLTNHGTQLFSNCYISGAIDFIWGWSQAYFEKCTIATIAPKGSITAQARAASTDAGGYVFNSCHITYTSSYGSVFGQTGLGRPYSQNAIVVYMNSFLDKHISPAGWNVWSTSSPQTSNVVFAEYNNNGPGQWNSARAKFATLLTSSSASRYTLANFLGDTSWIDMTAFNYPTSFPAGPLGA